MIDSGEYVFINIELFSRWVQIQVSNKYINYSASPSMEQQKSNNNNNNHNNNNNNNSNNNNVNNHTNWSFVAIATVCGLSLWQNMRTSNILYKVRIIHVSQGY